MNKFEERMLAVFSREDILWLHDLINKPYITSQEKEENGGKGYRDINDKHAAIRKRFIKRGGLIEMGTGTNRFVLASPDDNDVVYKIAVDKPGLTDNSQELLLSAIAELSPYVAKSYYSNGVVLVQERLDAIFSGPNGSIQLESYINPDCVKEVGYHDTINEIMKYFILNDNGPTRFRNWGIDKRGVLKSLDYAYLKYNSEITMQTCPDCNVDFVYADDMEMLQCPSCLKKITMAAVTDGYEDALITQGGFSSSTMTDKPVVVSLTNKEEPTEVVQQWDSYMERKEQALEKESHVIEDWMGNDITKDENIAYHDYGTAPHIGNRHMLIEGLKAQAAELGLFVCDQYGNIQ